MRTTTHGIHLHFIDQGHSGPALIFLHYWGGSSRTWAPVVAALPQQQRSIRPDLRGWGDSAQPADGCYALSDFADDIAALIDRLQLDDYVLVGHSMGGKIAQLLASRRPCGLRALVLVAPAPPGPLALPAQALATMASAYESRQSVEMAIDHMLTATPLSPALREQVISDSLRGAPAAKAAWPQSTSREDIRAAVERIDVPTLVIAGEYDQVDPANTLRREVVARIPQARLHILPGSGHLSPLEAPAEIAALISGFIADLLPAKAL